MDPLPTVKDCERIAAGPDPVLRNLQITQCYAELAAGLRLKTGPQANWCHFATWASKQAGQTIRKEDLKRTLEQRFEQEPVLEEALDQIIHAISARGKTFSSTALRKLIWEALDPEAAMQRAAESVAIGNRKVFAEIGRPFAGFLQDCTQETRYDPESKSRFCASLRAGDPPDGQAYLQQAFGHYYEALFETDIAKKTQLLFLANLEVGFHEQTRLQPEITQALEAAVVDPEVFFRRIMETVFPGRSWVLYAMAWVLRQFGQITLLEKTVNTFLEQFKLQLRMWLTEHLMSLELPNRRLALGADLKEEFPENLREPSLPDLQKMLGKVDLTTGTILASGAADWANLPDRMHFIADFFRCYHEKAELTRWPFSPDQVRYVKAGRMPEGNL